MVFIHPLSDCKTKNIGNGTRIWQFTVIMEKAIIGKECNICANVLIENNTKVGDYVTIKSGVQIWEGITIEDNVFVGPNVTFTNDKYPRRRLSTDFIPEKTIIKKGATLGAGCIILPGVKVGENSFVGAGAVVTKDVLPKKIVIGNPAKEMKKI